MLLLNALFHACSTEVQTACVQTGFTHASCPADAEMLAAPRHSIAVAAALGAWLLAFEATVGSSEDALNDVEPTLQHLPVLYKLSAFCQCPSVQASMTASMTCRQVK